MIYCRTFSYELLVKGRALHLIAMSYRCFASLIKNEMGHQVYPFRLCTVHILISSSRLPSYYSRPIILGTADFFNLVEENA